MRRWVGFSGAVAVLVAYAALAAQAQAQATVAVTGRLEPDRLGVLGAVGLTVRFDEPGAAVPAPVRRAILRFPAGFRLEIPHLRSCPPARLRARGPRACPAGSQLGAGHAIVAATLGAEPMTEHVALAMFLGPLRNLHPTVEVLGQGYTPFDRRLLIGGLVGGDTAPYGERLELAIPPVATLPREPDASIVELSLTVGGRAGNAVGIPSRCPAGGFSLAGEFLYADGSSVSASTAIPCP